MNWKIDPTHSEVTFGVRHMMVATVRGRFEAFDATIELDPQQPELATVTATVDVASLATGNADRDTHLRSTDFFDAEQYPTMTFVSQHVERDGAEALTIHGALTIRNITHQVALRGEFSGPVAHLAGGTAIGLSLAGEIDRELFGLTRNAPIEAGGVLIGKKVKIGIEAELIGAQQVSETAPAA